MPAVAHGKRPSNFRHTRILNENHTRRICFCALCQLETAVSSASENLASPRRDCTRASIKMQEGSLTQEQCVPCQSRAMFLINYALHPCYLELGSPVCPHHAFFPYGFETWKCVRVFDVFISTSSALILHLITKSCTLCEEYTSTDIMYTWHLILMLIYSWSTI